MPHSSGGGSGGGGSHGGSRGSSGPRISTHPFRGAHRYRYLYRGETAYFYSDRTPQQMFSWVKALFGLLVFIPFIIIILMMTYDTAIEPYFGDFPPHVLIKDDAHVMKEPEGLRLTLEDFYEKSGIPAAVITVNNETWQGRYPSLEKYAYDRYLQEFSDEMHWLIVYSEPKEHPAEFTDWCWEGMQGNYTDPVLTEKLTAAFRDNLQTRLECGVGSIEFNINQAFLGVMKDVKNMTIFTPVKGVFMAMLAAALLAWYVWFTFGFDKFKYRNAVPVKGTDDHEGGEKS